MLLTKLTLVTAKRKNKPRGVTMTSKRKLQDKKIAELRVEFSVDDELIALVHENTHNKTPNAITSVLRCITLIASGTSMGASCKLTGIPLCKLNRWRKSDWYPQAVEIIKQRLDEQLDGQFTRSINVGVAKLHERLEHGDPYVAKDGTVQYKPVTAKDAAFITGVFFDKRNLLRNKPTHITAKQITVDERLALLGGKFKEIAAEAEYTEVFDDEESPEYETTTEGEVRPEEQIEDSATESTVSEQLGHDIQQSEQEGSRFTFREQDTNCEKQQSEESE